MGKIGEKLKTTSVQYDVQLHQRSQLIGKI